MAHDEGEIFHNRFYFVKDTSPRPSSITKAMIKLEVEYVNFYKLLGPLMIIMPRCTSLFSVSCVSRSNAKTSIETLDL